MHRCNLLQLQFFIATEVDRLLFCLFLLVCELRNEIALDGLCVHLLIVRLLFRAIKFRWIRLLDVSLNLFRGSWVLSDHIPEDVMNLLDQLHSIVIQCLPNLVVDVVHEMLRISLKDPTHFLANEARGEIFYQLRNLIVQALRWRAKLGEDGVWPANTAVIGD